MARNGFHCKAVNESLLVFDTFVPIGSTHIPISLKLVLKVSMQICSNASRASWATVFVPSSIGRVGENVAIRVGNRDEDNVDAAQNVWEVVVMLDNLVDDVHCSHGCEPFSEVNNYIKLIELTTKLQRSTTYLGRSPASTTIVCLGAPLRITKALMRRPSVVVPYSSTEARSGKSRTKSSM
jgi:hypothetical protein